MLLIIKHHNSKEPISRASKWSCPSRPAPRTLTDPLLYCLWQCRGIAVWLEKGSTAVREKKPKLANRFRSSELKREIFRGWKQRENGSKNKRSGWAGKSIIK